jgi:hypothetical protein
MTRTATLLLTAALMGSPAILNGQSQSPDQQQENNKPDTKPKQPHADRGDPHNNQSPDIQQQKNSGDKTYKGGTTTRQAHGNRKPKGDTATSH